MKVSIGHRGHAAAAHGLEGGLLLLRLLLLLLLLRQRAAVAVRCE